MSVFVVDAETDIKDQFLDPEPGIIGEQKFRNPHLIYLTELAYRFLICGSNRLGLWQAMGLKIFRYTKIFYKFFLGSINFVNVVWRSQYSFGQQSAIMTACGSH